MIQSANDAIIFDADSADNDPSTSITVLFPGQTNTASECDLANVVTLSDNSLVSGSSPYETFQMLKTSAAYLTVTTTSTIAATGELVRTASSTVRVCYYTGLEDIMIAEGLTMYYYQSIAGRQITLNQVQSQDDSADCAITWDFQMPVGTSVAADVSADNKFTFTSTHESLTATGVSM